MPASDNSQHRSIAGTEASGTPDIKFVMNGGLIVGTRDGANIEIREECGDQARFIFDWQANEVEGVAARAKARHHPVDDRLQGVFVQYKKVIVR